MTAEGAVRTADEERMGRAIAAAAAVRLRTSPNPWVGCVLESADGRVTTGATEPPGGRHAEAVAIDEARERNIPTIGATVWTTLEPCSHHGRTPPCADALIDAGVARVVAAVEDPDDKVAGRGIARLREAGIEVVVGVGHDEVTVQLAPYLHHRRTGRPWVVLKAASSLDGRSAAPDGTSQWITGPEARLDAHRLRAESDAVLVGAGTVRVDDPSLTVRIPGLEDRQPLRVVLGNAPAGARVHPCLEMQGPLVDVLDTLGGKGVVQLLVEGGPMVAGEFVRAGLVNWYVFYFAPAIFGGDDGKASIAGSGAPTIADVTRGRIAAITPLGPDVRIDMSIDREV